MLKRSLVIMMAFLFTGGLFASNLVHFRGRYEDKFVALNVGVEYASWMLHSGAKKRDGVNGRLFFRWILKNQAVKQGRLFINNKRYPLNEVRSPYDNSISIKLGKPKLNYFIQLSYMLGMKRVTRKLIVQQGKLGSGVLNVMLEKASPFDKGGYKYIYNSAKNFFTMYDLKNKKIANIKSFDNGPDYFSSGLRRVIAGWSGKYGFINKKNRVVIKPRFDFAYQFKGKYAIVIKKPTYKIMGEHTALTKGKFGVINKSGRIVIPLKYESIFQSSANHFKVVLNGKQRVIRL